MAAPTSSPPRSTLSLLLPPLLLALVLWSSFVLKLHNLDHTALTHWDEVFHAIVAQNVAKHPLQPTLIDVPYLPYDATKWGENHVWLHKPILPFWQIALSLTLLGVNTFALRLPSALLSTGAVLWTYFIGKELLDRRAALVAAVLQAVNPFLLTLVQGYQFADHIDIALLFWVEAGIYFLTRALRTGTWRDLLLAGTAQGLAFLCKSYLAGIIFGVALTAWLLPLCRCVKLRMPIGIGPLRLLGMLGATAVVIAPWLTYCLVHYPQEFWHEEAQIRRHLSTNIEGWAAPWDRVVFNYLIVMYGVFYTPVLVAIVALLGPLLRQRPLGLWLVYAWGFGVLVPHLFAATKTPSATLIGLPAFLLLFGALVAAASRGERWPLLALTTILFASVFFPAVIRAPGYGHPNPLRFAPLLRQNLWVVYHVAGALAGAGLLWLDGMLLDKLWPAAAARLGRYVRWALRLGCLGMLIWLGSQTVLAAWHVTSRDENDPVSVEVGNFARAQLPANAVLLCEERLGFEHLTIMFYGGRTSYALQENRLDEMARSIAVQGGVAYVVSYRELPLPAVHQCAGAGPTLYRWQPR